MVSQSRHSLIIAALCLGLLQGCAAVAVGAAAVGVSSASDPRTIGTQIDDQTIEMKANAKLGNEERLNKARVVAVSYNNNVLLIGQAPTEALKRLAEDTIRDTNGINQIFNQIRIGSKASAGVLAGDSWITSKIKLKFASNEAVPATSIKVVTENAEVFLLGNVTQQQANAAIEIARNVDGVERVIKALTIKG
ncbi:osmotically-inducible protein OsmY [Idiomarina sp. X4]|uniref:division/outer membrane stress-associated lipid-binding lipoprotein n=1 Tax=unclassified Idiomarina TaxID=2614829 RepID=UPI000C291DAB|nr:MULTISPECIES: division/outer membrane stress-associated lipid-binding lipoprotein [unclassified Idiomarina]ATZ72831.1 osmotically-inducible protein OsmY [Idiomarina sp. X4]RXS43141.1 divisome-associated lipoprotein YraP [Idiomarina sp. 29L]